MLFLALQKRSVSGWDGQTEPLCPTRKPRTFAQRAPVLNLSGLVLAFEPQRFPLDALDALLVQSALPDARLCRHHREAGGSECER
jgi:hypothetical protein